MGGVHNPPDLTTLEAAITAIQEDVDAIREVTDSEAILTEVGGQITTDGTEQTIYTEEAPAGIFRPVSAREGHRGRDGDPETLLPHSSRRCFCPAGRYDLRRCAGGFTDSHRLRA